MHWLVVLTSLAACASEEPTAPGPLAGHFRLDRIPPDMCQPDSFDIVNSQVVVRLGVMLTGMRVGDPVETMTGEPNVEFQTHEVLGGEGGIIDQRFRLWLDNEGGTGTVEGTFGWPCHVVASREPQPTDHR